MGRYIPQTMNHAAVHAVNVPEAWGGERTILVAEERRCANCKHWQTGVPLPYPVHDMPDGSFGLCGILGDCYGGINPARLQALAIDGETCCSQFVSAENFSCALWERKTDG